MQEARLQAEHAIGKADAAPANGKKEAKKAADEAAADGKSSGPQSNGDTKQDGDAMQE